MQLRDRRRQVEKELQSLSEENAVEVRLGEHSFQREIADDRGARVGGVDVQDVLSRDATTSKSARIIVVLDLENSLADILRMFRQKTFDVMSIDRRTATVTEVGA